MQELKQDLEEATARAIGAAQAHDVLTTEMDALTASVGTIEQRLRTLVEARLEPIGAGPLLARLDNAGYAIQLIGVHKKELLLDFVRLHGLHDNSGIFHTEFNGKDWHVLLYGFYSTFREAKRQLDKGVPGA